MSLVTIYSSTNNKSHSGVITPVGEFKCFKCGYNANITDKRIKFIDYRNYVSSLMIRKGCSNG